MDLNFFIDKRNFPYEAVNDLEINNIKVQQLLSLGNTSLTWILRTYLELKNYFQCRLTDTIPTRGITFFFRGSINISKKPNKNQYWICIVADATWHPFSHINIYQNALGFSSKNKFSFFVHHWPQTSIIKSNSITNNRLAYFGDYDNLADELKSEDWNIFLNKNNLTFNIPNAAEWNDYSNTDIVIAIRSFKKKNTYVNKPASKLINCWLANSIFVSTNESAYMHEREDDFDFVLVDSYQDLKNKIAKITQDMVYFNKYKRRSLINGEKYTETFFTNEWINLINNNILPGYDKFNKYKHINIVSFIVKRYLEFKIRALRYRLLRKNQV